VTVVLPCYQPSYLWMTESYRRILVRLDGIRDQSRSESKGTPLPDLSTAAASHRGDDVTAPTTDGRRDAQVDQGKGLCRKLLFFMTT